MAMARVWDHLSVAELERRFVSCTEPVAARHTQAIWLLAQGRTVGETSKLTAFGERWIQPLLERYDADGPDALGNGRRRNGSHRRLARLHRRKDALLRVLERPEIPLHTNGSENDIRACVTKRRISGGTMSEAGRVARDVRLGLMKTCNKLGVSFFRDLGDRLGIPDGIAGPALPDLVRQAAKA